MVSGSLVVRLWGAISEGEIYSLSGSSANNLHFQFTGDNLEKKGYGMDQKWLKAKFHIDQDGCRALIRR